VAGAMVAPFQPFAPPAFWPDDAVAVRAPAQASTRCAVHQVLGRGKDVRHLVHGASRVARCKSP